MAAIKHQTITQGRKTIVFGLPWYVINDEEAPRKAAIALTREIPDKFDLIVARKSGAPQFGLATSAEGAKSGAISAASIVASIVNVDSWLYVLEIENNIWICSGRDGYILPEGDRIYENRDEARRAFHALNPSSFKAVYLPASWKVPISDQDDISDVAEDVEETDLLDFVEYSAPKWGKLTAISQVGGLLKISAVAILLATVGIGGSMIYSNLTAPDPQEALNQSAIEEMRRKLQAENAASRQQRWQTLDANKPWQREPEAALFFKTCIEGIRQMPTHPIGYQVLTVTCDGNNVDAAVKRTSGYSTWLHEWAESRPEILASTSNTGDQGHLSIKLDNLPQRGNEALIKFNLISDDVLRIGQIEGSSVNMDTPAAKLISDDPEYVPIYAKSSFDISTKRPEAWKEYLDSAQGVTLKRISLSVKDKLYKMEGEIYVPNI